MFDESEEIHPLFAGAPSSTEFKKLRKRIVRETREAIDAYGMVEPGGHQEVSRIHRAAMRRVEHHRATPMVRLDHVVRGGEFVRNRHQHGNLLDRGAPAT